MTPTNSRWTRAWLPRYRVREGQMVWEIDEFADRKLLLAEVELKDREGR